MKFNWNFQSGRGKGGGGLRKTIFCGGDMDFVWNYIHCTQRSIDVQALQNKCC